MPTIDINAGTIHYEATGPENGRPVVFVHGYMMGGQLWRQVSERLAELGLRCIAPTWPLGAHPQPLRPGADRTRDRNCRVPRRTKPGRPGSVGA